MSKTLLALVVFVALVGVMFSLGYGTDVPGGDGNITLGADQRQYTIDDPDASFLDKTLSYLSCVTPGLGFLTGDGFVCDPIQKTWDSTIGGTTIGQAVTTFTQGLGDFVRVMGSLMSFQFPCDDPTGQNCAPAWVAQPFSIVLIVIGSFIVIALVRGVSSS